MLKISDLLKSEDEAVRPYKDKSITVVPVSETRVCLGVVVKNGKPGRFVFFKRKGNGIAMLDDRHCWRSRNALKKRLKLFGFDTDIIDAVLRDGNDNDR